MAEQATRVSRRLSSILLSACASFALISVPVAIDRAHLGHARGEQRVAFGAAADRTAVAHASRGAARTVVTIASVIPTRVTLLADGQQWTVVSPAANVRE